VTSESSREGRRSHLKADNEEEDSAGDVYPEPEEDHGDAAELSAQVDDDEHGGQEPAAAPRDVHVLALLGPLHPHADAVLEEGGDEAEARQVRQDVFRLPSYLNKSGAKCFNLHANGIRLDSHFG